MKKSKKIVGLVTALLVSITTTSNEVSSSTKQNLERILSIVSTSNPIKKIELTGFPKIEFPKIKYQEPTQYDWPKRLDKKTLDEFIDFIYAKIKVSKVIDKEFVKSIIDAESERYVYAKSKVGARGLMQVMPDTWNTIGEKSDFYKEAFNPYKNLKKGITYLDYLNTFCEKRHPKWNELSTKDKYPIIAAAYNGGISRLMKNNWDISKMPEETKLYVEKIKNSIPK